MKVSLKHFLSSENEQKNNLVLLTLGGGGGGGGGNTWLTWFVDVDGLTNLDDLINVLPL